MCEINADPLSKFVDDTIGSAKDLVSNTTNSMIESDKNVVGSIIDMERNALSSARKALAPVTKPVINTVDNLVGQVGLPKNTFKDLDSSMEDAEKNVYGALDDTNETAGNAAKGISNLENKMATKVQKGAKSLVNRSINDPGGLLKQAGDMTIAGAMAGDKPVQDALSRWTGGSGNAAKDAFGEDVGEATTNTNRAGTSAGKAAAGVVLAAPTGGASLMLTADEISKAAGGTGNIMKDMGANDEIAMGAHIAAAVMSGVAAGEMVGAQLGTGVAGSAASGAASGATQAAVMGASDDQIANAALLGGVQGGMTSGMKGPFDVDKGDTKLVAGSKQAGNAATVGGASSGAMAAAQGKSGEEIRNDMLGGALAAGGSSAIGSAMDVGRAADGKVQKHYTADANGNMVPDKGFSPELLTAQVAQGFWTGGVQAETHGKDFAEGAAVGMAGGLAGGIAQQGAEAAGYSETVQAGANKIATPIGQYAAKQKPKPEDFISQMPAYEPASAPAGESQNTSARAEFGGLLNNNDGFEKAGYVSPAVIAAKAAMLAKYKRGVKNG